MDNLKHHVQYSIAGILAFVFAIEYGVVPSDRKDTLASMLALLIGFIVGKFTNNYGGGYNGTTDHAEREVQSIRNNVRPNE